MVVHVGTGGDDEATSESPTGKRGASRAAVLTIVSDVAQAEVRVAAAFVHRCAAVPVSSGGRTVGRQGRSGGGASSADAAAAGEHADADTLANALRIEQQEELIGRMLERVELLEAQREAQA